MIEQLTLNMPQASSHRFAHFVPEGNFELLHVLQHLHQGIVDKGVYLWGEKGLGKTHLLQSCCHHAIEQGLTAIYLTPAASHACLQVMSHVDLVAIDDLDDLLGSMAWEKALYQLYNQLAPHQFMVVSGRRALSDMAFLLPDLRSRIQSLVAYPLKPLSDQAKRQALVAEAERRGLQLSGSVLDYLFVRHDRSLSYQMHVLNRLDKASLVAQRRLTVPFIKSVLAD